MEKKKTVKKTTKKATKPVVKKAATTKKITTSTTKSKKKKKRAFTLIELLAVIIILGILMIIAIPAVTSYISDSRKSAYVNTAKEVVAGTRNLVNEGKLGMYDTNTTYYIPAKYVNTENELKSPYGEFLDNSAYVGVIYNGQGYKYYWISSDDAGQGVPNITLADKLDTDDIVSDLNPTDIQTTVESIGIGNRTKIRVLNSSNGSWKYFDATGNVSEEGGKAKVNQIPSCPNCVFTFTESGIYTVWNTRGGDATVFQQSDYEENYKEVEQYGDIGEIFYGVVLNENNQVERAYVCGADNGKTICIEGSNDGSKYNENANVLKNAYGVESENSQSGYYVNPYDHTGFAGDELWIENHTNGTVQIGNRNSEWYCMVKSDGYVFCGM